LAGVEQALNTSNDGAHSGAGQFSISKSGSLVYAPGDIDHFYKGEVVLVDRNGKSEVLADFNKPEVTN
jgi:hypothetical protein